jgi:CHAT domain-containing protein
LSIHEQDWTNAFEHLSAAIELYPKISPRAFTADEQQRTIRDLYGVAQIAASCALNADQDPGNALEVLEAGRGIMAGWLINARNDVSRLEGHDPELAARYTLLRDLISNGGRKTETEAYATADNTSSLTRQDQWRDYLYELEEIEETVRSSFPVLKSFQRPLSVDDMKKLAMKAPIVEINSTVLRSDAFIVTTSGVTTIDLPHETNRKMEDITNTLFGLGRLVRSLPQARGCTNDALRTDLKWLYENVVSRIMAELKIKPNSSLASQRLIWVSNGLSSFCPLHAADTFSGNRDECTAAHVISSYIPSLKALQFARERHFTLELHGHNEVLVVAMPKTKGLKDISAIEEAENITSSFSKFPANSVNVLKYPSHNDVLEGLKDSSLAHFACHGYASSTDPSQSCLLLVDSSEPGKPDRLSARDLSASKHNLARLCYLSACSTAENTAERLTDENIHVASAFQLSGYSHVIGTLWEAGDRAAVQVAKVFYDELADAIHKNSGGIIADDVVAYALHKAVKVLQEKKQPGSRLNPKMDVLAWAPFIHLGP